MTLRELSQLHALRREIEMDEIRLKELEVRADPNSPNIENIRTIGGIKYDSVGDLVAELDCLRKKITNKKNECIAEMNRLEDFVETIDDSFTRQIFILKYVCGMNWDEVSRAIGGGNTPDGVKKRCQRYIWKHSQKRKPGG